MTHFDVVIVGAGLSGIGAARHLQQICPGRTYAILESRDVIGGTWDVLVADEPGDGNAMVIVDPNSEDSCFYKVEVRN